MKDSDFDKLLTKAKIALIRQSAFFASVFLSLKMHETDEIATIATDGECIIYNKKFLEELDAKYLASALAHETVHVAMGHIFRRGNRDKDVWNVAADVTTNYILKEMGYALHPSWIVAHDLASTHSTEQIYSLLINKKEQQDSNFWHDLQNNKSGDGSAVKDKIQRIVARAAQISKLNNEFGSLPNELKRYVEAIISPTLEWRYVLRDFVTTRAKEGVNWNKRNRRYNDFFLPAAESFCLDKLLIAIDTSGSINKTALNKFMSEVHAIRQDVRINNTVIVSCDAKLHNIKEFSYYDTIDYTPVGGGGTSFVPVFEFAEENQADAVIYFTDGCGTYPKQTFIPTLWALTNKASPPWGNIVFID